MDKIVSALKELQDINSGYQISNEAIEALLTAMENAKVCIPVVGKFSSGKSALINAILGYKRKILRESITPETAVPAEIMYHAGTDKVTIFHYDGTEENMEAVEYQTKELNAKLVKHTTLELNNSFLGDIPDVKIVDMPGFESGFEIHNKAIDEYLPQSMAYLVAFPADDMTVKKSMGNILKELSLQDMPFCVVITKYDKKNDDYEGTFRNMQENLKRYIDKKDIAYCITSADTGDVGVDDIKNFLREIQNNAPTIMANKYKKAVYMHLENTENYLNMSLKNNSLTESELVEEEERMKTQLYDLERKFTAEKESFDQAISDCMDDMIVDVENAIKKEESNFVAMSMNGQSINEQMNTTIRNAVIVSAKKRLVPEVNKYLKKVVNCIQGEELGDIHLSFSYNTDDMSKSMVSTVVAFATGTLVGGPLLGMLVAGVTAFINKLSGDKKRDEKKSNIRQKLRSDIYPQVLREVGDKIKSAVAEQTVSINASIEKEIRMQRELLEKAILDLRNSIADEKEQKENFVANVKQDLIKIEGIKDELR